MTQAQDTSDNIRDLTYDMLVEHETLCSRPKATARHFAFTMWNWKDDPSEIYGHKCSYIVWQREICASSGRLHLQGYMQMSLGEDDRPKPTHVNTIRELNPLRKKHGKPKGSWLVSAKGSAVQNFEYCTKADTRDPNMYEVEGDNKPQIWTAKNVTEMYMFGSYGKMKDSHPYYKQLRDGTFDLEENDETYKFGIIHHAHVKLANAIREERERKRKDFSGTKVFIHFGVPRSGKSHSAKYGIFKQLAAIDGVSRHVKIGENRLSDDFFVVPGFSSAPPHHPWFDRYAGESRIIINELSKNRVSFDDILEICDIYPMLVQSKGSTVWRNWTEVHLIGNGDPEDWFPDVDTLPLFQRVAGNGGIIQYKKPVKECSSYARHSLSRLRRLLTTFATTDNNEEGEPDPIDAPDAEYPEPEQTISGPEIAPTQRDIDEQNAQIAREDRKNFRRLQREMGLKKKRVNEDE